MRQRKTTQLNCFSPPVMIATLIIEFSLAAYTVWRYKLTVTTRLIVATFVFLALFQLSEYFVCTGSPDNAPTWSRMGFVAISVLPPLGIHLLHVIAGKSRRLVPLAYATMAIFVVYFLAAKGAFFGYQCNGNYVIYQIAANWGGWYTAYYYGWLAMSLILAGIWATELMKQGEAMRDKLNAIRGLMIGWLSFIVPTIIVGQLHPETQRAIPSIMCGFAVLFALILGFYVLPRVGEPSRPSEGRPGRQR